MRSEKCVVRGIRRCANVYLHKPGYYSLLHTYAVWYSLLLLGYKPVEHVTVLNTVGSCNTMILRVYYNLMEPPSYMRSVVMRRIPVVEQYKHADTRIV
jgi:hypothetical protein